MSYSERYVFHSRRDVSKGLIVGAGIVGLASVGFGVGALNRRRSVLVLPNTAQEISIEKKVDSSRILTSEELTKLHIKINNSSKTSLFFTQKALEVPIFKALQEGKLKGLTITLVDSENLALESVKDMPQEARVFYDLAYNLAQQDAQGAGTLIEIIGLEQEEDNQKIKDGLLDPISYEVRKNARSKLIAKYQQLIDKSSLRHIIGLFVDPRKFVREKGRLLSGKTDYLGHIGIFVAVGERLTPDPLQSYSNPDTLRSAFPGSNAPYLVDTDSVPAGYVLRHELFHFITDNETATDALTLAQLKEAYEKSQNGDPNDYFIFFENEKGTTRTQYLPLRQLIF